MSETTLTPPTEFLRHGTPPRPGLRILYLCHRIPYPPDKGDRIRAFHEIEWLAARHRVHLLTMGDAADASAQLGPLAEICEKVEVFPVQRAAGYLRCALAVAGSRPLTLSFFESREMRERVRALAAAGAPGGGPAFDAIVAYSSSTVPYADLVPDVPRVLDMVDVDSAKWAQYARTAPLPLRPVYRLEARRLRAFEAAAAARFDRVVLATSRETRLLLEAAPEARAVTIPNGVDLDFFRPLDLPKSRWPTLVFTGQMDYFANVDGVVEFAKNVFPRLRRRFPDLELLVVGRSPVPAVRALADQPGVIVTGAVGDIRPFLSRAWVFVAPLRIAQGVQNKVLEAMASNLPVVATGKVFSGLAEGGFREGEELLAADDDREFEEKIAGLLADGEARARIGERGRRRVEASYRWRPNLELFESVLGQVVARRKETPRAAEVRSA